MWDDDVVRPRTFSSADLGAMARRPSIGPSSGASPLPAYNAPPDLPPAYSERDPHPEHVPWWKRARRSIGRGARKLAGWLGLGSLLGGGR